MRIISLLSSLTETVCALGLEKYLVGRSHECDFPPSVHRLPVCSEPKINIHGTSLQIDNEVKAIVRESLSVYRVDVARLQSLKPDMILTQDQCEVCAVSLKDVEAAVCQIVGSNPKIVTIKPEALSDVWDSIMRVAEALGDRGAGMELVWRAKERMNAVSEKARRLKLHSTVVCIEWIEPLMAAGNWVPEMTAKLGADSLFSEAGKHSPWISWEDLREKDPDVIVTMPCGWDIKKTLSEMPTLTANGGWKELKAVRNNRVYVTDGNQYFNRPGPRLVESLEILAEILYPEHFSFGHKGSGWVRLG